MTERRSYQQQYRQGYKDQAKRVNLTFTKEEYRAFFRAATKDGSKITPYIKQLSLAALSQQAHVPADVLAELKVLRFALYNIANNVNQIAHHANTIKAMTLADENNLLGHLKQLDDVVQAYVQGRILNAQDDDY